MKASTLAEEVEALMSGQPDVMADRFPVYTRLRAEAPVYRLPDQVLLTRWSDVSAAFSNPAFQSGYGSDWRSSRERTALDRMQGDEKDLLVEILGFHSKWLTRRDGDSHERLRKAAHRAFTPAAIQKMQDRIQAFTDGLIEDVAHSGRMEAIADFAYHLPLMVVCNLLGMPVEDRFNLRKWAGDIAWFGATGYDRIHVREIHQSVLSLRAHVRDSFERQRDGGTASELTRALLTVVGDGDDQFILEDVVAMVGQLVFAGHETTTNLIANCLHTLLTRREQWELLLAEPALIPNAVEEMLRWKSSLQRIFRVAAMDTEIEGVPIRQWDTVSLFLGSANRDPERFPEPDTLDLRREDVKHIGFGLGPHFCLGAALNRMETTVALSTLLRRFPEMSLATATVEWQPNVTFCSLKELPVILGPDRG